jgi:hypothetical protein
MNTRVFFGGMKDRMKLTGSKGIISLGACLFFGGLLMFAWRFAGTSNAGRDDTASLMALMNLTHLPAGYHRMAGNDTANARALWIEHDGASENARVLVFLVENDDPSSSALNRFGSSHMNLPCHQELEYPKNIGGKYIKVIKTSCHSEEGAPMLEQQGIFHMYKGYSAVIDESADPAEFDHAAFNTVLSAVAHAKESDNTSSL